MADPTYEYEPYIDPRTFRNPAGYIVWKVERSPVPCGSPTRTSMGYCGSVDEVKKFYPNATLRA
jgi:hypothetical protein